MNEMSEEISKSFKEANWTGFTGFTVKAKDTEVNRRIHSAFQEFCKYESDNNYTQGLKILLTTFENTAHFEALFEKIAELEAKVQELEQKSTKKEEKDEEVSF